MKKTSASPLRAYVKSRSNRPVHSAKRISLSLFALLCLHVAMLAQSGVSPVSADKALALLKSGNQRFVTGKLQAKHLVQERKALVKGQAPYAIILCCSDSRVPPEIVFDESLGKLFVVRVAGNVVDPVALGSIEYAAEHLHTKLLFVMGHESCGAVKAALDGGHAPPHIDALVERIAPAVERARRRGLDEKRTFDAAVEENVRQQMSDALKQSAVLHEMVEKKELTVRGGVYNLHSGKVEYLSTAMAAAHK